MSVVENSFLESSPEESIQLIPPPNPPNVKLPEGAVAISGTTTTYLIPTKRTHRRRLTLFVFCIFFFGALLVIMILCIVFLAPQTPYNLGPTLCCSPQSMYPGQRLQNGNWSLKLDTSGTLTLYEEQSDGSFVAHWSTDTEDLNVTRAYLNPNGTLQLLNQNQLSVWSTAPAPPEVDLVVPKGPYTLHLGADGITTINSSNGVVVWEKEPDEGHDEELLRSGEETLEARPHLQGLTSS